MSIKRNSISTISIDSLSAFELATLLAQKQEQEASILAQKLEALEAEALELGTKILPLERQDQIRFALDLCQELGIVARIQLRKKGGENRPNGRINALELALNLNPEHSTDAMPMLIYLLKQALRLYAHGQRLVNGSAVLVSLGINPNDFRSGACKCGASACTCLRASLNSIDSTNVAIERYGVVLFKQQFLGFVKTASQSIIDKQKILTAELPAEFFAQYTLSELGEFIPFPTKDLRTRDGMQDLCQVPVSQNNDSKPKKSKSSFKKALAQRLEAVNE